MNLERIMGLFRQVATLLNQRFINKEELVKLLLVSTIAGEHVVIIGPPGTAKSAIIRTLARLIDARYFEYLLTRFTEPNELFGPVDIQSFREGSYRRRTDGMLPECEIAFCDEVFKANSAILNSLLTLLNERRFANGNEVIPVPLLSLFGASNEIPNDEALGAIYDRFLIRVYSDNLEGYHFQGLIEKGIQYEQEKLAREEGDAEPLRPILTSATLHQIHRLLPGLMRFNPDFINQYKNLVFQIRSEGISLSDRRVVKFLKLFAANALFDGRKEANETDFFILKHIWNNLDQREILNDIVEPVLERYYERHPQLVRAGGTPADIESLRDEVALIERLLAEGQALSDIQLFNQLQNLNAIKQALRVHSAPSARELGQRVDHILENIFRSSKFDDRA